MEKNTGAGWTIAKCIPDAPDDPKPGPGSYSPELKSNTPGWSMAGRHTFDERSRSPGPGTYSPGPGPVLTSGKGISFGIKDKVEARDKSPGPAAYTVTNTNQGPQYSFRRKPQETLDSGTPGPGAYYYKSKKEGGWTIAERLHESQRERSPGAAAYSPGPGPVSLTGKGLSFGLKENPNTRDSSPGPAAYAVTERNLGPQYSFRGKHHMAAEVDSPGPGTYYYNPRREGGWTIAERLQEGHRDPSPGPGAYGPGPGLVSSTGKGLSFGLKENPNARETSPGPAAYAATKISPGPQYSFRGKHHQAAEMDTPGPGTYYYNPKREGGWTIAERLNDGQRDLSPGPGAYSPGPGPGPVSTTGKGISFGLKDNPSATDASPGPAAYGVTIKSPGPQYSLRGKIHQEADNDTPGPGTYYYNPKKEGGWTIAERLHEGQRSISPGPGAYSPGPGPVSSTGKGYSFGIKDDLNAPDSSPGPAAYAVTKKNAGPEYSFRGKHHSTADTDNPGPGSYYYNEKREGGWTIAERLNDNQRDTSPGPGAYSPGPGPVSSTGKGLSFGTKHDQNGQDSSPGPAAYSVSKKIPGPQYSIRGKHNSVSDMDNPSPGAYSIVRETSAKSTKPAYSFSTTTHTSGEELRPQPPG